MEQTRAWMTEVDQFVVVAMMKKELISSWHKNLKMRCTHLKVIRQVNPTDMMCFALMMKKETRQIDLAIKIYLIVKVKKKMK